MLAWAQFATFIPIQGTVLLRVLQLKNSKTNVTISKNVCPSCAVGHDNRTNPFTLFTLWWRAQVSCLQLIIICCLKCKEEINCTLLFQTFSSPRPKLHPLRQGWIQPNFEGGTGREGVKDIGFIPSLTPSLPVPPSKLGWIHPCRKPLWNQCTPSAKDLRHFLLFSGYFYCLEWLCPPKIFGGKGSDSILAVIIGGVHQGK